MADTLKFSQVNRIPSLTWNWLKMNRDSVSFKSAPKIFKPEINDIPSAFSIIDAGKINISDFPALKSGIGEELSDYLEKNVFKDVDQIIELNGKAEGPLLISLDYSKKGEDEVTLASSQLIYAKKDSEACIIFLYEGNDEAEKIDSIIRTKVYAEENAKIHIVKVQLLGKNQNQVDETSCLAKESSFIHFTQLELGGNHINSGLHTDLVDYKAKFKSELAFICSGEQNFDINHVVYHYGQQTDTNMLVKGVVDGKAVKNYRGTIDFKNGCSGATGNELEETLLMSPAAINKSIPVILCDEEDVSGSHGATLGRLGSEELFYMQTRGICESEAKNMMKKAKVLSVSSQIPNELIQKKIESWLENK